MANKLMLIQAIVRHMKRASFYHGICRQHYAEAWRYTFPLGYKAGDRAFEIAWHSERLVDLLTLALLVPPTRTRAAATPRAVLSVDVASLPRPVVYGGDITLEVGLAESLALLNWYQMTAAAHGVDWLAEQQEGGDNG